MILATEDVIRTILKVISATTKVILTTEEVITATLKIMLATTKVILATGVSHWECYLSHCKVILAIEEVI